MTCSFNFAHQFYYAEHPNFYAKLDQLQNEIKLVYFYHIFTIYIIIKNCSNDIK
jgi:hypothetical protein